MTWFRWLRGKARPTTVGPPVVVIPPVAAPPETPPGQGPPDTVPPGQDEDGPPGQGPGGEGPPGQNGGGDPGNGPPIPDGNVPPFPTPAQWPTIYGQPWRDNWWQEDYDIDVVVGSGQPPQDHYEPRHIGAAIHVVIHERAAAMYLSLDVYWELLAKAHGAMEAEFENERGWAYPQQRFLRPKSESPPASYPGCLECQGSTGCARVHDILAKSRGKTNLVHRQIHELGDEEIQGLMVEMHRYMTCVRADIWSHERSGISKARDKTVDIHKPYASIADLPPAVRKLPAHGQEIYLAAFNAAYKQYDGDEGKAHATAWAAVKMKYEQVGRNWVAKKRDPQEGIVIPAGHEWINLSGEERPKGISWYVPIAKADDDRRLVYGVVLEPGDPKHLDAQKDFVKAEEIELSAHDFMKRWGKQQAAMGLQHQEAAAVDVVESYIALENFTLGAGEVKKGSWVLVAYVRDEDMWQAVKAGELTGFSIGGEGERVEVE